VRAGLRTCGSIVPQPVIAWLYKDVQSRSDWIGRLVRTAAREIATGEGTIRRGPATGLRIDATGRMAGYVLGTADYDEQTWFAEHVASGSTFYDIGANVGFFTLVAAKIVGAEGVVVAFEPLPANVRQLEKNVALNALNNVTVIPTAVGSIEGLAGLVLGDDARDNSRLSDGQTGGEDEIEVPVTTVDAAVREHDLRMPDVIKIDVEGAEIDVLRGALETIRRSRPLIVVEVHGIGSEFADFADQELSSLGYRGETMSTGEALPRDGSRFHAVLAPVG
jgi:FkbM family methyltransferase